MTKKDFLVVLGLGLAAGLLFLEAVTTADRLGVTALDVHEKWVRQNLYTGWAVRPGHIIETYLEPVRWQKTREILFANPVFLILIAVSGWFALKKVRSGKDKSEKRRSRLLVIGLVTALMIFTWELKNIPAGIYVDEAVTGYNAWSVLVTGRDEYGKALPILFKYFGSWLPGLNIYFLVPAVKVLGLSELAVRLPAALLGVGVCLVIYALIKLKTGNENTAGLGLMFLPVIPWMTFNARLGYEEMLGFILFTAGCGLLYRSVKAKENLKWAVLALSLASYDAHVFRYLMGIILPIWVVMHRSAIQKWPARFIYGNVFWLVITQIPNLMVALTPAFWVKQVIYEGTGLTKIAQNFAGQMVTYFSPMTLFVKIGDIDLQHQIPGTGLFVWWMAVPVVWGILIWVMNWRKNRWWLALLLSGAVPAAMSGEFISVQRALPLLLPLTMAMAEGLNLMATVMNKPARILLLGGLWIYSALILFRSYFVLLPGLYQEVWNWEYKQLAQIMAGRPEIHFVIDNTRNKRNYILPLFHMQFHPRELQAQSSPEVRDRYYFSGKMTEYHYYANMEFRPIYWQEDICRKQILVGDELSISVRQAEEHFLTEKGRITGRTGKVLLKWYETNPEKKCGESL